MVLRASNKQLFNPDGITLRISKEGLKSYLKWKDLEGEAIHMKDFNRRTQQALRRYGLFVYQGKRFSRRCYLFLGYSPRDPWDEWELLYDSEIWDLIDKKIAAFHPDKSNRKTSCALVLSIKRQLEKRKRDLAIWHLGEKPEYISVMAE